MIITPLYGHASAATAYYVSDYPYGNARCRIRFWLESHPKKGFRFCSQTEHPKTLLWNTPKKSTYALIAACMFLDEKNHCHWASVHQYSSSKDVLDFITKCPKAVSPILKYWIAKKLALNTGMLDGSIKFVIAGVPQEQTETDKAAHQLEVANWKACLNAMEAQEAVNKEGHNG